MEALEAAARALWLTRNPGADPGMWDKLTQRTQISWAMAAATTALAVCNVWENH